MTHHIINNANTANILAFSCKAIIINITLFNDLIWRNNQKSGTSVQYKITNTCVYKYSPKTSLTFLLNFDIPTLGWYSQRWYNQISKATLTLVFQRCRYLCRVK